MIWLLILIFTLFGIPGPLQTEPTATLAVRITNLRSQKGQLGLSVFRNAEGWPEKWKQAERWTMIPVDSSSQEIIIAELPTGRYAVSVFHDENNSGDLDKNIMGIPKEGYGVSNNAQAGLFGPPKFEDALINLESNETSIEIEIAY